MSRYVVTFGVALVLVAAACGGSSTDVNDGSIQSTTTVPADIGTTIVSPADDPTTAESTTTTMRRDTTTTTGVATSGEIKAGAVGRIGDWEIAVVAYEPDGTQSVLDENQFNDPPDEGSQFAIVTLAASYVGQGSSTLFEGVTLKAVGSSAVAYDFDDTCGVIPNELRSFREVFTGGVVVGDQCWAVSGEDATTLIVLADEGFGFSDDRLFLMLPARGSISEPTFSPAPILEAGASGTRGNPLPLGDTTELNGWEVSVLSSTADATDIVLRENQFNDPPTAGRQFFIVDVSATYLGSGSDTAFAGLAFSAVGESSVAYDLEDTCGVIPDEFDAFNEVFSGGTITGNVCWSVRSADVQSLVLILDEGFGFDGERFFLALS